jgi:hypothetical protein
MLERAKTDQKMLETPIVATSRQLFLRCEVEYHILLSVVNDYADLKTLTV